MVMTCYGCLAEPSAFILEPQKLISSPQTARRSLQNKNRKKFCASSSLVSSHLHKTPAFLFVFTFLFSSLLSTFQPLMSSYQNQAFSSVIPSVWNDPSQMSVPVVIQVSAETSLPQRGFYLSTQSKLAPLFYFLLAFITI